MTDRIHLHRIAIYAHHGVFAEEQSLGQRFYVSVTAELSLERTATTDALEDTVHYGELAELAHAIATTERFNLIEALAGRIAEAALDRFSPLTAVTVAIEKPNAPIPLTLESVTVEVTRRRMPEGGR